MNIEWTDRCAKVSHRVVDMRGEPSGAMRLEGGAWYRIETACGASVASSSLLHPGFTTSDKPLCAACQRVVGDD